MLDQLMLLLPVVHAAATWFMVGLIWFVQIVHYPLMTRVGSELGVSYALAHQRRTTWIVAPVMLVEASTALTMAMIPQRFAPGWASLAGLVLLALIWASTFCVQVPLHARLTRSHDLVACRRLVLSNWIRTAGWSARGLVALVLVL